MEKTLKIKNIKRIGKSQVYDLTVSDNSEYITENGVINHNTGSYYSSNNIYIIGRQQEKTGKELDGYNFVINVEKSRYVKEKSKLPVTVLFDAGLSKYSGLLDIALETGHVIKPKNAWYQRNMINVRTGEEVDSSEQKMYRKADTDTSEFWNPILEKTDFKEVVKEMFMVGSRKLIAEQETEEEIENS